MAKPTAIDISKYTAAMEALAVAEQRVLGARQRRAEFEARAEVLSAEARDLERQRNHAIARGEMDAAASLGKAFAVASDGAKDARHQAAAFRDADDVLLVDVFAAEQAADDEHKRLFDQVATDLRAKFIAMAGPAIVQLWRAAQAADQGLPIRTLWVDLFDAIDQGDQAHLAAPIEFPARELSPRSALLGPGSPRRWIGMGGERGRLLALAETRRRGGEAA